MTTFSTPRFGRSAPFFSVIALVLFGLLSSAPSVTADPALKQRVESILGNPIGESAIWGIYVQDLESDEVLYSQYANMALIPASNQKLLTTATALDALGSDYRYETTLHFVGEIDGSVLRGDLIIEGSGDPTFGSKEVDEDDPLERWAEQLAEMGVTRIEGRIIGDDDVFDGDPYAEGWDVSHISRQSYAPPSGGLTYRDNLISLSIRGAQPGRAPTIVEDIPGYFQIENRASTSAHTQGRQITINRSLGAENFNLTGSVNRNYRGSYNLPVSNPTAYALHSFKHFLENENITVDAEVSRMVDLTSHPRYEDAEPLFTHFSPPLSEIINAINKKSNNLYAEQLFRTFGWGGTTDGATRRVRAFLTSAGINTRGLSILDGSGLSRKAMITPEAMGKLLAHMYRHEEFEAFKNSLARGGENDTTLEYRLNNLDLSAKTGSLQAVRALSGYTTTQDGHPVAFVVFANNYTIPSSRIARTMDDLIEAFSEVGLAHLD